MDSGMPLSIAALSLTVLLQQDTSLVILIHDILPDVVALLFKKVVGPKYLGHEIISLSEL